MELEFCCDTFLFTALAWNDSHLFQVSYCKYDDIFCTKRCMLHWDSPFRIQNNVKFLESSSIEINL